MCFVPPYRFVTASNLASALLKRPSNGITQSTTPALPRRDIAIVDVRDDDFEGGNIIGASNVPSASFVDNVEDLVLSRLRDVPTVIFHCSLSQARGPKAARIYSEVRQAALQRGDVQPIASPTKPTLVPKIEGADQSAYESGENGGQNILVLRDGFANFGRIYKDNSQLVENYDEDSWTFR